MPFAFGMCRRRQGMSYRYHFNNIPLLNHGMVTCSFHMERVEAYSTTILIHAMRGTKSPERDVRSLPFKTSPPEVPV